ncbi:DUF1707 domain-containing protein [Arachnia propionica]|nr:DUF1707 domain-containing protein [Arachnia propionica]
MSNLHVSFKERDVYLDILSENYSEGRLSDGEFAERQDQILSAVTHGQCREALRGLVVSREEPFPGEQEPPVPQPVAPPRRSRRSVLAAGVAGLGLLGLGGLGILGMRVNSYTSGSETITVEPFAILDGVAVMAEWEDWPRMVQALEAAGVAGVQRLSIKPGELEGEVSRLYDGRVLRITTHDKVVRTAEVFDAQEHIVFSLEDFGGERLVSRMTDLVKETWPGVTRVESIRLRGSDGGGDIRVTFTEGDRTRTALIDSLSHRILDVMDG